MNTETTNKNNKHYGKSLCDTIHDTDSSPLATPDVYGEPDAYNATDKPFCDAAGPSFKPPLNYHEQLEHLLSKYKLKVANKNEKDLIVSYLKKYNYYRLRGYWITLLENDIFKEAVTFQDAVDIMLFDKEIRHIIFQIINEIEVNLRTNITYILAKHLGGDALNYHKMFKDIKNYQTLKKNINSDIARATNNNNPCVIHNLKKYGRLPIWAQVEVMTFGNLSKLYGSLKNCSIKREIASVYGLPQSTLKSWLQCMNDLRNACAHHDRLYNRHFAYSAKYVKIWKNLKINGNLSKTLFVYVLVMFRLLYSIDRDIYKSYYSKFCSIIGRFPTVDLQHIAFPNNWKEIIRITNEKSFTKQAYI